MSKATPLDRTPPEEDAASLFPLPLVPFEQYMLTDDRRRYPMTFPVRAELDNVPDREVLEAAFRDAMERHPLLTCRVARRRFRCCWVPSDDGPPPLRWIEAEEPELPLGRYLDIRRESPVEGCVAVRPDRAVLGFLFHHAATDGIGALQFVGDLLAAYARRLPGEHRLPNSLPIEAATLKHRGQFDLQMPYEVTAWEMLRSSLYETWKVLIRRPRRLSAGTLVGLGSGNELRTMLIEQLDADAFDRYCRRAQQLGVTTNDLALRDMFLTVNCWNSTHSGNRRGWLRINMPTSLRGKRDLRMPAANVLGYALLTRHDRECGSPDRLLHAIAHDTKAIQTWSLGAMFVDALRTTARVPFGMFLGTRLMQRPATIVLSNLGNPTRRFRARFPQSEGRIQAGDVRLISIVGTPPIRPGTRMALAIMCYGGRLEIGVHSDPRYFSPDDARTFVRGFVDRMKHTADELDLTAG